MRWPQMSIRSTVLASIVVGVVLPALVLLALDGVFARRAQEPVVERNRQAVAVLASATLTEPAWTLSEPGIEAAMQRILQEPSVCGIEVHDLQPDTPPLALHGCLPGSPVVHKDALVLHEGQTVARVRLAFDDSEIDRLLAERRTVTAWLVAAQVGFGIAVLAGVLSLRLLRPIGALKRQAGALAAREPEPPPAWPRRDELGELGQHLGSVHQQIRSLIGELEHKNAQLERLAMYDHLTGLPNRTLLRELFVHEAARARREGQALALLFVDLDHFKTINDQHGHATGDELLVTVGARLRDVLRESDIACRMGGDEFLVLLPHLEGWQQAAATGERLLQALRAPMTLHGMAEPARIDASVGIALFPADGADFDALVRAADVAMYRSKDLGRGRCSLYHPEMDATLRERLALERDIAGAAGRGELRLMLQPIVDARSGEIRGAEALVRWLHPQRGLVPPLDFIPFAEQTGFVRQLTLWVFEEAARQWRSLAADTPLRLAVNLSTRDLMDVELPARFGAILRRHEVPASAFCLEITESAIMDDPARALATLRVLSDAGFKLSIDDFGTGYSSLAYLQRLPVNELKIDRSFVKGLVSSAGDAAIVRSTIDLAHHLGLSVVAEGIEDAALFDALAAMGCDEGQGYHLSRPMPLADFRAWAARWVAAAGAAREPAGA